MYELYEFEVLYFIGFKTSEKGLSKGYIKRVFARTQELAMQAIKEAYPSALISECRWMNKTY